jgi:hypothetical protein
MFYNIALHTSFTNSCEKSLEETVNESATVSANSSILSKLASSHFSMNAHSHFHHDPCTFFTRVLSRDIQEHTVRILPLLF